MPFEEVLFGQLSIGEMSDRGTVCLGNCRWESVCRGMSVRVMFVWEMTSGNYPSEKYPSRNCSSGKCPSTISASLEKDPPKSLS